MLRGFEQLAHKCLHSKAEHQQLIEAVADPATDLVAFEKSKIKGAIRTDFILSAEIIAITLGRVADAPLMQQVVVLSAIAIVMTVGVYGLVGGIVKLDELGLRLTQKPGQVAKSIGGGILPHGVPALHHWIENVTAHTAEAIGGVSLIMPTLLNAVAGIIAGAAVLVSLGGKLWRSAKA